MTKEELAARLNGRQIGNEITPEEEQIAEENKLLVIYGASDDLAELRGATTEELSGYGSFGFSIDKDGCLAYEPDIDDRAALRRFKVLDIAMRRIETATRIEALWCEEDGYSWTYSTEAPHATFDVMDNGSDPTEKYCRGIVIDLKEIA